MARKLVNYSLLNWWFDGCAYLGQIFCIMLTYILNHDIICSLRPYILTYIINHDIHPYILSTSCRQIFGVGTGKARLCKINLEKEHGEFLDWFSPSGE
jgi:hypothetical protein